MKSQPSLEHQDLPSQVRFNTRAIAPLTRLERSLRSTVSSLIQHSSNHILDKQLRRSRKSTTSVFVLCAELCQIDFLFLSILSILFDLSLKTYSSSISNLILFVSSEAISLLTQVSTSFISYFYLYTSISDLSSISHFSI